MDDKQPDLKRERPSHCPRCDGAPRLLATLPDSKRAGGMVWVYRCTQCDVLIWVD